MQHSAASGDCRAIRRSCWTSTPRCTPETKSRSARPSFSRAKPVFRRRLPPVNTTIASVAVALSSTSSGNALRKANSPAPQNRLRLSAKKEMFVTLRPARHVAISAHAPQARRMVNRAVNIAPYASATGNSANAGQCQYASVAGGSRLASRSPVAGRCLSMSRARMRFRQHCP